MLYVISYDLNTGGKDYAGLWRGLDELGAKRVLFALWVVQRYNTSSPALRDYLWRFLDRNDRLLVASLDGRDWAGTNLMFDPGTLTSG